MAAGKKKAAVPEASLPDHFSAKKAVWLFMRHFAWLKEKERAELLTIRQASAIAETMYQLVQELLRLLRSLQGERLDLWITKVAASHIKELSASQRVWDGTKQLYWPD